eukprot:PITA_32171
MVEEYDSIVCNSVLDLVPRLEDKSMVISRWLYKVWQGDGELFVSQGKYSNEILRRFHLESNKPMETPLASNLRKKDATSREVVEAIVYRRLVVSLMYLVNTQPNICYAINQLSQAMVRPTKLYWKATNHLLRHLMGTSQYGLWYRQREGVKLQGFTDVYWARIPSDRKSTSEGIFSIGSAIVSWYNRKQILIALNSAEVEYMAASQVSCEAI